MNKAIFVDREGVLIVDKHHLTDINKVEIIRTSIDAVKIFNKLGYLVIGISNQSVVARGLSTENEVNRINNSIINTYKKYGAVINKIYFCPHHPDAIIHEYKKL